MEQGGILQWAEKSGCYFGSRAVRCIEAHVHSTNYQAAKYLHAAHVVSNYFHIKVTELIRNVKLQNKGILQ